MIRVERLLKKQRLAGKLIVMTTAVMIGVFTILIVSAGIGTSASTKKLSYAVLQEAALGNTAEVQAIFDAVDVVGRGTREYMLDEYSKTSAYNEPAAEASAVTPEEAAAAAANTATGYFSPLYGIEYHPMSYEEELVLRETFRSFTLGNKKMNSIVIGFEPYQFDPRMEGFSMASAVTVNNGTPYIYGTYDEYSQKRFYTTAKAANGEVTATLPFNFEEKDIISMCYPLVYNNKFMGAVGADIALDTFDAELVNNTGFESLYSVIIDADGTTVYNKKSPEKVGKELSQVLAPDAAKRVMDEINKDTNGFFVIVEEDGVEYTRRYEPLKVGNEVWWVATAVETNEITAPVKQARWILVALSVGAMIIIIITVMVILKKSLAPLQKIVAAANKISEGNFDIDLHADSDDEIGDLAETFSDTAAILKSMVGDLSTVLEHISRQDLTLSTQGTYVGELLIVEESVEKIIANLNMVINEIIVAADQVTSGSNEMTTSAQALAQGAAEQSGAVENLVLTMNEMSEQIKDTADRTYEINELITTTGEQVNECNVQMDNMMNAMSRIDSSSGEIGKIIKTIEDIAFQTNILALNAAVEAARAGAAGKGFAVVADEVRNLAAKSAEAVKNTTHLIESSLEAVAEGTQIAEATQHSMKNVVECTSNIMTGMEKIYHANAAQARSVEKITDGVDQISSVVQTNSATAEESAAVSEELSAQAHALKNLVSGFQIKQEHRDM